MNTMPETSWTLENSTCSGRPCEPNPHAQGDDEPDKGDGRKRQQVEPDRQDPATIGTPVERDQGGL
jgi:hypothetical protein